MGQNLVHFLPTKTPLKIGQIPKKEDALEETAKDDLNPDVNNDGDKEKSNSEKVLNESPKLQDKSSSQLGNRIQNGVSFVGN